MLASWGGLHAQPADSAARRLDQITIQAWRGRFRPVDTLPDIHRMQLLAGKQTEVIQVGQTAASLPDKQVRQVFAKIPGAFAYDMDGSGNQVSFALRGLDPHRSWDLNVRQNGVLLNSDLYGYPASHYNPPMEAIERIELVRGTAALQYGAMFGGMLNYVTRQPDTSRAFAFEHQNSAGSFGLLSMYNAAGGRKGRLTWQAYDYRRVSQGYRENGESSTQAQFASLTWKVSERLSLRAEAGRSTYQYQIPGPLNDSMFRADPRQATRSRNYYSPDILVSSLTLNWRPGPRTQVEWVLSHLRGDRSSVQLLGASDRKDTISRQTGQYAARQVDIDWFNSSTSELRVLHRYGLGGMQSALAAGIRLIYNDLNRQQLGRGTTGTDYDLTLTDPNWGRDLHYRTRNAAVFAENQVRISRRLLVSPGIRAEYGLTEMTGIIRALPPERVPADIRHRFVLGGISFQYRLSPRAQLFGGIAQAYRPVVMGEVIPANALERTDPDLRDSRGYNAELGFRAAWLDQRIRLNMTLFRVEYRDRIGLQAMEDGQGELYFLRTNIGDSRSEGVECYAEGILLEGPSWSLSVFSATAWMNARYLSGALLLGQENVPLAGNRLESAPRWTSRNGLQAAWKQLDFSLQYSYTGETFSDPFNTVVPAANGSRGLVPAYAVWDAFMGVQLSPRLNMRLSVSNLTDRAFFTKRPVIYPGPGVWPSDGRSLVVSLSLKV